MKKHATVDPIMSITVGPAAEVRDLSDDPTALAEAQATLERHEAKNSGRANDRRRAPPQGRERDPAQNPSAPARNRRQELPEGL